MKIHNTRSTHQTHLLEKAAKHMMGLVASQYAGGPGKKRKRGGQVRRGIDKKWTADLQLIISFAIRLFRQTTRSSRIPTTKTRRSTHGEEEKRKKKSAHLTAHGLRLLHT